MTPWQPQAEARAAAREAAETRLAVSQLFPLIPPGLVEALCKRFPEITRPPRVITSDREVWMAVGMRDMLDTIQEVYEEQQQNIDPTLL